MLLFGDRKKIADAYEKWMKENPEIKDCPLSVVSFMEGMGLVKDKSETDFYVKKEGDTKEKYIVFADYVATKIVGETLASSKEEAVEKLKGNVDSYISLCTDCEEQFIEGLRISECGIYAEKA